MKILFIHFLENIGGGERYLINLVNEISKKSNITLLTPTPNNELDTLLDKKIRRISTRFKRNFFAFPFFSPSLFVAILKILKREKIDIIHLNDHYLLPTFIPIKMFLKTKIVFTSHGLWDTYFWINKIILKVLDPIVICSTEINYNRYKDLVSKRYLLPFFTQNQKFRKNVLGDKIKLGLVGRFSPVKNHLFAFEILESLGKNYELHLFGDKTLDLKEESDKYRKSIIEKANQNVIFHGIKNDLKEIYSQIDILLVTSISESFSMVSIEALSFGIPIISTKTEGSNTIIENGVNGFVCGTKEDFCEKINIITKNYQDYSQNAYSSSKKFDKDFYIKKLMEIYVN